MKYIVPSLPAVCRSLQSYRNSFIQSCALSCKLRCTLLLLFTFFVSVIQAQSVIPIPLSVKQGKGSFLWTDRTVVGMNLQKQEAEAWAGYLKTFIGSSSISRRIVPSGKDRVDFIITSTDSLLRNPESYRLSVRPERIELRASSSTGLFYGLQTLRQLMKYHEQKGGFLITSTEIYDTPRFSYRGCMIDVSRHFFPPEFLKKQIALLSFYKINRLHLHLTDGAGWRLEIKKYPRLTDFAAWRTDEDWQRWWMEDRKYASAEAPGAYGGYYTQEQMRDIVAYARQHHITVIPEIEMPAHTEEVLAAYPELSCSGEPYKNAVFCAGEEKTFSFLQDVLTEVMDIFPSEYIHIGGDEAYKGSWKTCPKCLRRMELERIPNVDALQSYLIRRVEKFLNARGRQIIGWDEILEGGLAPNATVMSWRGEEGGIAAARSGHCAVMTPGEYCYLDAYQDAPYTQPEANGRYVSLEKSYSYNPVPSSLSEKESSYIIGVQGNLWTEYIPDTHHAEYMLYPRILALAEVAWSDPKRKSLTDFHHRLQHAFTFLRQQGVNYFDPDAEVGPRPQSKHTAHHLASCKNVIYNAPYAPGHPAGGTTSLTDGKLGDWVYGDGVWQGFVGEKGMDVTIDLEKETLIQTITADFMQVAKSGVYIPRTARISISSDNVNFTLLHEQSRGVDGKDETVKFVTIAWKGCATGRYIRFEATPDPLLKGFIFTDEIQVK